MVGHHRCHHNVRYAVEHGCEHGGIRTVGTYNIAQYAVQKYRSCHVAHYEQHRHEERCEVELGRWHEHMVDPVERQQQEHEERMAQRVPVQTHARDEYQREDIVARHIQVVVEHRPEAHVRPTCEGVVVGVYEQCVEHGEH